MTINMSNEKKVNGYESRLKKAKKANNIMEIILLPFMFVFVHAVLPACWPACIILFLAISFYQNSPYNPYHFLWIIPLVILLEIGGLWIHDSIENDPRPPASHL